jgi:hypothetical protein
MSRLTLSGDRESKTARDRPTQAMPATAILMPQPQTSPSAAEGGRHATV